MATTSVTSSSGRWPRSPRASPGTQGPHLRLLFELYDNETEYTQDLYDSVGLTEDVKKFLRYNANKALMNLGYGRCSPRDETDVSPGDLSALSPNATVPRLCQVGSSCVIGKAVVTGDEDWDF